MAPWDDQRVKPHVRSAALEISKTFGITNIGGYSYRDIAGTNTLSDHAKGLALDVMCNFQQGPKISAWAVANAQRLSVKYVIWNRQIWENGSWTPYRGVSPHIDHVHISFQTGPGNGGPNVQGFGGLPGLPGTDTDGNMGCAQAILKLLGMG